MSSSALTSKNSDGRGTGARGRAVRLSRTARADA
jgi:hypothetical protein